jgi:hypothetical protein
VSVLCKVLGAVQTIFMKLVRVFLTRLYVIQMLQVLTFQELQISPWCSMYLVPSLFLDVITRRLVVTYIWDNLSAPSSGLTMELVGCAEMSVTSYQSTLHNIPEERRSHLHQGRSLKSCMCLEMNT